jgi:hypothetical protein
MFDYCWCIYNKFVKVSKLFTNIVMVLYEFYKHYWISILSRQLSTFQTFKLTYAQRFLWCRICSIIIGINWITIIHTFSGKWMGLTEILITIRPQKLVLCSDWHSPKRFARDDIKLLSCFETPIPLLLFRL